MSRIHQQLAPCLVTPDCLECPLPLCKHDGKAGQAEYDRWRMAQWLAEVKARASAGATTAEIALELGVTARTVYRRQVAG